MSEFIRLLLVGLTVAMLAVMWRGGYRGEAVRIIVAAFALFTGDRAMHFATGGLAFLLALASSVVCAVTVLRPRRTAPAPAPAPQDDYPTEEDR